MLTLHFAPNSRAGRIVWLLEELGLEYDLNRMDFHPKDLKSDAHRERHPLGRVPVLDDGDIRIWESGAIVEYISGSIHRRCAQARGRIPALSAVSPVVPLLRGHGDASHEYHRGADDLTSAGTPK